MEGSRLRSIFKARVFFSGRRGTRTPKRLAPPPVFKTASSSGRMPSVRELRGLDLNQHDDGQSVASCRWMTPQRVVSQTLRAREKFGEKGSNLRLLVQSQAAYR